jgi:hypothetical protein
MGQRDWLDSLANHDWTQRSPKRWPHWRAAIWWSPDVFIESRQIEHWVTSWDCPSNIISDFLFAYRSAPFNFLDV